MERLHQSLRGDAIIAACGLSAMLSGCGLDQNRQREALVRALPEVRCGNATFTLVEDERGVRGNGFTTVAIRSATCARSLREALKRRGSREIQMAENLGGWNIPGSNHPASHADFTFQGPDIDMFTFNADGSVLWQRYAQ